VYIYVRYRKIKTGVSLSWTTLYTYLQDYFSDLLQIFI